MHDKAFCDFRKREKSAPPCCLYDKRFSMAGFPTASHLLIHIIIDDTRRVENKSFM